MTAADWLPAAVNDGWTYRERVPAAQAGLAATAFYALRHRHSDRAVWRQRLADGEIARNGEILRWDAPLASGDRLAWHRPPWLEQAVPAGWAVVHDDGDLLVLDKPAGLPVLPAGGWLEHTVLRLLERRHKDDPAGIPRPVHRLGRFTSGLLVCARRPTSRAWLSAALRDSTAAGACGPRPDAGRALGQRRGDQRDGLRGGGAEACGEDHPASALATVEQASAEAAAPAFAGRGEQALRKLYRALLTPGALTLEPGSSLEISAAIGRRPHPRLGWIWCAALTAQPGDLPAHSRLTVLERWPQGDLVQVAIGSGRPHQIRIHCAAVGAPLFGDPLYLPGGVADPGALPGDGGYRLQAWRLELQRPDGQRLALQVSAGLGDDGPPRA
jgi:23S rRNA pseudouridine1911/1915/1917 synthase